MLRSTSTKLALVCVALLAARRAAAQGCTRIVPLSAFDEHGRPIVGLTAQDFAATIHGKPVAILNAERDEQPHRVVVILDASGSMSVATGEWDLARAIAADVLRAAPKAFQAGLVVFNDAAVEKYPVGGDPRAAMDALTRIQVHAKGKPAKPGKPAGRTAIWDALDAAMELLDPPQFGDALYLISDAEDNASKSTLKRVAATIRERGARVYLVYFNPWGNLATTALGSVYETFDLVSNSGGSVVTVPSVTLASRSPSTYKISASQLSQLNAELATLYGEMRFVYRLTVSLPDGLKKATPLKMGPSPSGADRLRRGIVYPKVVDACSAGARP